MHYTNRFSRQQCIKSSEGGCQLILPLFLLTLNFPSFAGRVHFKSLLLLLGATETVFGSPGLLLLCILFRDVELDTNNHCWTRGVKGDWSEFGSPPPILSNPRHMPMLLATTCCDPATTAIHGAERTYTLTWHRLCCCAGHLVDWIWAFYKSLFLKCF